MRGHRHSGHGHPHGGPRLHGNPHDCHRGSRNSSRRPLVVIATPGDTTTDDATNHTEKDQDEHDAPEDDTGRIVIAGVATRIAAAGRRRRVVRSGIRIVILDFAVGRETLIQETVCPIAGPAMVLCLAARVAVVAIAVLGKQYLTATIAAV